MNRPYNLEYYDRREGRIKKDAVPAARLTYWTHNTRPGRWVGELFFGSAVFSRLYGKIQKTRWSRRRVGPLIEKHGIDPEDMTRPAGEYSSFHEFFIRDIDPVRRPFVPDPDVCAAPADGRVLAYPDISPDRSFPVKRAVFNLREFLRDDRLAGEFAGGTLVVSRLGMGDYHYVHFPFRERRGLRYRSRGNSMRRGPIPSAG